MSCPNGLHQTVHQTRNMLRFVAHRLCRRASTSSNPYPYPTHSNPQPHQIFHLPRSATQQQIKERYYDLVRIYHPDSPISRKYPAEMSQARFQSVAKAYDLMRGRSVATEEVMTNRERPVDPTRFFRPGASGRPHFDETPGDERWKERILLAGAMLAIVGFAVQTVVARHQAMLRATQGARGGSSGQKYPLVDEALAEPTESTRSR